MNVEEASDKTSRTIEHEAKAAADASKEESKAS